MSSQNVTLNIPEALYRHLKHQAEQARRSVEEETLEVLAAAVPSGRELSGDLAEIREALHVLDDSSLWQAARSRLAAEVSAELEALHHKRQRDGSTATEERLAELMRQYERHLLVRAQAAALLKERGHDVGELVSP
jgi:hypothetical protein